MDLIITDLQEALYMVFAPVVHIFLILVGAAGIFAAVITVVMDVIGTSLVSKS